MKFEKPWRRLVACALLTSSAVASAAPVTLSEALAQAEGNAPVVKAAGAEVAAAEGRARQAGVRPNPELEIEAENLIGTGPYRGLSGTEVTATVGQMFERGGKRQARLGLARAELELARINRLKAQLDLIRNVRVAYAELLAAQGRLTLAQEATERAGDLARTARLLVETGRDPPLRQFRADAALAEARANEQSALASLAQARRMLSALAGLPETDIEAVSDEPEVPPSTVVGGPPIVVTKAEAERHAAKARLAVAISQGVPDVTARAGARGFVETGDVALVGAVSFPLPIRDRNRGGIEAARAELMAADARVAQARLDGARELKDAHTLLAAADARLAALEGPALIQAREAVRVARSGYTAGRFGLLDVLDAELALNTTLGSIIDARRDRARAIAALLRAQPQEELRP